MFNQSSTLPIGETTNKPTDRQIELNIDTDEDTDNESSDITNAEDWESQLHNWEEMLMDKEVARLEEEEEERDNYD
ncbi:17341_t:CDS:1, partial [Dentiscutata heterogama]